MDVLLAVSLVVVSLWFLIATGAIAYCNAFVREFFTAFKDR